MTARIVWAGRSQQVRGRLSGDFVAAHGRLLLRLDHVTSGPADAVGPSVWVFAEDVDEDGPVVLRSEIWQLPGEGERDLALRTLLGILGDHVRRFGEGVFVEVAGGEGEGAGGRAERGGGALGTLGRGRGAPSLVEWRLALDVPPAELVDYLASFVAIRRRCAPRPVPWPAEGRVTGRRLWQSDKERAAGAYQLTHLPGWLESRWFWSVLVWTGGDGKLRHHVQFSLPDKAERAVRQRFRLEAPG